jgi:hypothetical protein
MTTLMNMTDLTAYCSVTVCTHIVLNLLYRRWGTKVAFKKVLTVLPEDPSTSTTGTLPTAATTDTTATAAAAASTTATSATATAQQQSIGYAGAAVAAARDVAPVLDLTKDLWQKIKGVFVKDEEPADPALPIQEWTTSMPLASFIHDCHSCSAA